MLNCSRFRSCANTAVLLGAIGAATHHVSKTISRALRPVADTWEEAFDNGYDKGWRDCEGQSRRPVLVAMNGGSNAVGRDTSVGPVPGAVARRGRG